MTKQKIQPPKVVKRKPVKIQSNEAYELTMKQIDALMIKGEKNLRATELKTLRTLAEAVKPMKISCSRCLFWNRCPTISVINYCNYTLSRDLRPGSLT